ncbi:hypothetical protein [Alkalihalophilus marmarensis]|uniref:Uncharacterized protein n=1 Tax=Alkalihalophilus marmarensis DSM 21297 TaxID=1188261 RepID=U6SL20_9BACI|nr:hypothetical protein [Alkalihalophilus marmarensis]ERN51620.1 hypothetical protein A33I_20010 [Alkalihalophilus marmarensis DSM 21297]
MDLNNLISTIITSTAALVAIIGGFLVSRVISLASEQNSVIRKIKEIDNDLIAKKEIINSVEKYLFEDDLNHFVSSYNIRKIYQDRSLKEIVEEDHFSRLTVEQLTPYYNQLKDMIDEIERELQVSEYASFKAFKANYRNLKYENRLDWYEKIFINVKRIIQPPPVPGVLGFMADSPGIDDYCIDIDRVSPNTNYSYYVKEQERLEDDIKILVLQKKAQKEILKDYGKPVWVWSGVLVLLYASIVGIILPSLLLPYPLDTYNDNLTKGYILSLFYSQLILLFIYLSLAMYRLTYMSE